jgi:hypothetical protein
VACLLRTYPTAQQLAYPKGSSNTPTGVITFLCPSIIPTGLVAMGSGRLCRHRHRRGAGESRGTADLARGSTPVVRAEVHYRHTCLLRIQCQTPAFRACAIRLECYQHLTILDSGGACRWLGLYGGGAAVAYLAVWRFNPSHKPKPKQHLLFFYGTLKKVRAPEDVARGRDLFPDPMELIG